MRVREGTPTVTDCVFVGNSAWHGGGLAHRNANTWVINCRFFGNTATRDGGAMYSTRTGDPKIINSIFVGNHAGELGGAAYASRTKITVTNCTAANNTSGSRVYGGFYSIHCSPRLTNCVVWGNVGIDGATPAAQIFGSPPGTTTVNSSCVQGGWAGAGGMAIVEADPRFVINPDDGGDGWGVGDNDDFGDVRLRPFSPCLDVGDNAADVDQIEPGVQPLPLTDLAGNARIVDDPVAPDGGTPPVVDLGAFEYQEDCNKNAVFDSVDLFAGTSRDCNSSGIPDECESQDDCNANGVQDICEIDTSPDCNHNDILDSCDVASGTSADLDGSGVPDECERTLTGYWRFDITTETGCYLIDRFLTQTRYLRFDQNSALSENWVLSGGQYLKLNYPSTDGPSINRFLFSGETTANTDRVVITSSFNPVPGDLSLEEMVTVNDGTHEATEETPEQGTTMIEGQIDFDATSMTGTWEFQDIFRLCGTLIGTRLMGPPPDLPCVIDLEAVGLTLSTTDLPRPGVVDVTDRNYRVRASVLASATQVRYLLSADTRPSGDDVLLGTQIVGPGAETMLGLHGGGGPSLAIPTCVPASNDRFVLLVVDAAGEVAETDESNNVFALPVTFNPPQSRFDRDCDGDVGLTDFVDFFTCFTGPAQAVTSDHQGDVDLDAYPDDFADGQRLLTRARLFVPGACEFADSDEDGDVDLCDSAAWLRAFTGP